MNHLSLFEFKHSTNNDCVECHVQIAFTLRDWLLQLTNEDKAAVDRCFGSMDNFIHYACGIVINYIDYFFPGSYPEIINHAKKNYVSDIIDDLETWLTVYYTNQPGVTTANQLINEDIISIVKTTFNFIDQESDYLLARVHECIVSNKTKRRSNIEGNVLSLSYDHKVLKLTFF